MTYNGWTNYETWNVSLWVDNNKPLYREKIQFIRQLATVTAKDVEEFFNDYMNGTTPDLDHLRENVDVSAINFEEIAEHWETENQELLV